MLQPALLEILQKNPRWHGHIHGHHHWERVAHFGKLIAQNTPGVDAQVVLHFAYFHDCQRGNDGSDPQHGPRAAEYIESIRDLIPLDDAQFEKLQVALREHTRTIHHPDPTIGACFDADRLDLGRVGQTPQPKYLNTAFAKQYAQK